MSLTHQRHILFLPTPITPTPPIAAGPTYTYPDTPRWPMRTHPTSLFPAFPRTPRETLRLACLRWLPDGLLGRLHAACITNNHPSVIDRRVCRANPLGQPEPMFCSTSDDPFPTPITSTLPIPADSTYTYPTTPHGPCTPTAGASLQPSLPPTQTHLLRNLHSPHRLLSR